MFTFKFSWCIIANVVSNSYNIALAAVAEWQTRTVEGRVGNTVLVQVQSAAPSIWKQLLTEGAVFFLQNRLSLLFSMNGHMTKIWQELLTI